MNHPLRCVGGWICVGVLTGMCVLPGPCLAEDDATEPTHAELINLFQDQYNRGDYAAAKKTYGRMDPMQLSAEQRVDVYHKVQEMEFNATEATDSGSVLEQADAAQKSGDLGTALGLYKKIMQGNSASQQQRQFAGARLAEIARVQDRQRTRLRHTIDRAQGDIKAGRFDDAEEKLSAVSTSGLKLGWFDAQRVKRQLKMIDDHRRQTPHVVKRIEPVQTASSTPKATPQTIDDSTPPAEPRADTAAQVVTPEKSAPPPQAVEPVAVDVQPDPGASMAIEVVIDQPARPVETAPEPIEPSADLPTTDDAVRQPPSEPLPTQPQADSAIPAVEEQPAEPMISLPLEADETTAVEIMPDQDDDLLQQAMKQRAAELIEEARVAETNGQHHLAVERYADAATQDPTNGDARDGFTRLASADNAGPAPINVLEDTIKSSRVRVQAVIAEYEEKEQSAEALRKEHKYNDALRQIQQAKILLDRNEHLLPTATRMKYRGRAESREAAIRLEADKAAAERNATLKIQQQNEAENRRKRAEDERMRTVQELLHRALKFNKEQRYSDALREIDKALFIEPTNPAADLLRQSIEDNRRLNNAVRRRPHEGVYRDRVGARQLLRRRANRIADHRYDNYEATTPVTELVTYPEDWPQLTNTRLTAADPDGNESELNRAVLLKMKDTLDLPFEDHDLSSVLDHIQQTMQLNVFVNWPVLEAAGIEQDMPITIRLTNIPAATALKLVLAQASAASIDDVLDYSIADGIVRISTRTDLTRDTVVQVYDIRDLLAGIPNFDDAPQFDLSNALSNTNSGGGGRGGGNNSGGSGGGGSGGGGSGGGGSGGGSIFGDSDSDSGEDRTEQLEERRLEQIEGISNLIRDTVGNPEDWIENGGTVSSLRELNGQLIVKSTTENHGAIHGLLADLRETRAIQIHVEGRFLLVDQNFLSDFGMDLDVQVNNVGGNFGPISIAQDSFSLAARPNTGLPGSFLGGIGSGTGPFIPGSGFTPSSRSLDFGLSYLDDIQLNLMIRATQASRRSIALTAPRITFFNGQSAFVYVARQISFISDLEPVPDAGGFDPTLSVVASGVVLSVTGTVSSDRRYVTLTLEPSLATVIQPIRTVTQTALVDVPGGDPNDPAGQQVLSAFIEAPEIEITEASATVSIPDGGTLLMGGQRLVGEIEVEAGVPVLSKIPVLKRFFTNRSKAKDERTLLILIKPTIIIQSEEEHRLFPGLVQNP